jgi:ferredoxin
LVSFLSGAILIPTVRLDGHLGPNLEPTLIRPPGALTETDFLSRCIKCGQCMRVCPTNVIHPDGLSGGLESFWTPVLNFRTGTSGCQMTCIACGHVCPTAAIRPLQLDERQGKNDYADSGPIRIGTAFVDRGRCLPWAMDRPCIVCQENCPVSPKAIHTLEQFIPIRTLHPLIIAETGDFSITIEKAAFKPNALATGDYYYRGKSQSEKARVKIIRNTTDTLTVSSDRPGKQSPMVGSEIDILIRLQRPVVDPALCIGCGVCEHECPVKGKRAIRVTAENESRNRKNAFLL